MVSDSSHNPEDTLWECFSRDSSSAFERCYQASPRGYRRNYLSSRLPHPQPPCLLPDLLFLVHRHHPLSPPHPYRSNLFLRSESGFFWAWPIQRMHELGLLPLVQKFQILESRSGPRFSPKGLDSRILHRFSASTNVQELGLDRLDIPEFMPSLRRCFGRFLPTVRPLALREPKGSHRRIIYLIGLFQHLEDLKLFYDWDRYEVEPPGDPTLIPPSTLPLRGSLMITLFTRMGLFDGHDRPVRGNPISPYGPL